MNRFNVSIINIKKDDFGWIIHAQLKKFFSYFSMIFQSPRIKPVNADIFK